MWIKFTSNYLMADYIEVRGRGVQFFEEKQIAFK